MESPKCGSSPTVCMTGVASVGFEGPQNLRDHRFTRWVGEEPSDRDDGSLKSGWHRNGACTNGLWPPTSRARSAVPPARSGGLDNSDGGPERGVYIQMRGVEQVRIRGRHQRRDRAAAVACIAPDDVGEDRALVDALALGAELDRAAAGSDLGRGVDEDLHVRLGADHRAD